VPVDISNDPAEPVELLPVYIEISPDVEASEVIISIEPLTCPLSVLKERLPLAPDVAIPL
jgi:hypothetical protein